MALKALKKKTVYTVEMAEQMAVEYDEISKHIKMLEEKKKKLADSIKECASEIGTKSPNGNYYLNTESFVVGKESATSTKLNQDRALEFVKKNKALKDCVQKIEVVNEATLEEHYKNGDISDEDMKNLCDYKVTFRVSVKKNEEMPEVQQTAASRKKR